MPVRLDYYFHLVNGNLNGRAKANVDVFVSLPPFKTLVKFCWWFMVRVLSSVGWAVEWTAERVGRLTLPGRLGR